LLANGKGFAHEPSIVDLKRPLPSTMPERQGEAPVPSARAIGKAGS